MGMTTTIEPTAIDIIEDRPGLSLRHLVHVVYKRKWLVLIVFICSAVAATSIVRLTTKPVYIASSQILVSPGREQVVDPTTQTGGTITPWLGFNAVEQTAWVREILTGRFLAERVVNAIGPTVLYPSKQQVEKWSQLSAIWTSIVTPDKLPSPEVVDEKVIQEGAIDAFLKNVTAEPAGRSSIINLSFKHEDPELAAKVVNLLGEMYLERHLGVQKNPKSDEFFQEQLPVQKQRLAESEEKIMAFKVRHGITNSVKSEQELALQQQVGLRKELNDVRSKLAEVESRDVELRRQMANTSRSPGTIDKLRDRLTTLELQENELALRLTAQNPALMSVREEIRKLKKSVNEMEGAKLYGSKSSQNSLYADLQAELLHNEAEGRALLARQGTQITKIAELQAQLDTLERIHPEFNRLEKQLQLDENNSRLYLTKFEESRISGAMDAEKIAGVRVIEQARLPLKPIDSKRRLKILMGILFSGIGAIVLAFLLQFLGGSLDTAEDVERSLELPVLASIPRLAAK